MFPVTVVRKPGCWWSVASVQRPNRGGNSETVFWVFLGPWDDGGLLDAFFFGGRAMDNWDTGSTEHKAQSLVADLAGDGGRACRGGSSAELRSLELARSSGRGLEARAKGVQIWERDTNIVRVRYGKYGVASRLGSRSQWTGPRNQVEQRLASDSRMDKMDKAVGNDGRGIWLMRGVCLFRTVA